MSTPISSARAKLFCIDFISDSTVSNSDTILLTSSSVLSAYSNASLKFSRFMASLDFSMRSIALVRSAPMFFAVTNLDREVAMVTRTFWNWAFLASSSALFSLMTASLKLPSLRAVSDSANMFFASDTSALISSALATTLSKDSILSSTHFWSVLSASTFACLVELRDFSNSPFFSSDLALCTTGMILLTLARISVQNPTIESVSSSDDSMSSLSSDATFWKQSFVKLRADS